MTTATSFTLAEFLRIPEQKPALEFNPDGTITQKMAPNFPHPELQVHVDPELARRQRLLEEQDGSAECAAARPVGGPRRSRRPLPALPALVGVARRAG